MKAAMTKSTPPDGPSSDTNPPQALRRDSLPSTLLFPKNLVKDAAPNLQLEDTWKERLLRISKGIFAPRTAVLGFIGLAAIYSFGIGRSRYTSVSEFVVQQPTPMNNTANTILSGAPAVPQSISSLLDGQYLSIYLTSPDIKNKLYPEPAQLEALYAPERPDFLAGLSANSDPDEQVSFFRKQISIQPKPLSGSILIRTHGFQPEQALELNQSLLAQAQKFVNEVNQSISVDQQAFAQKELQIAEEKLKTAKQKLQAFQDQYGQLNPELEQETTSSFIAQLESNLVDLKVELATLKRRYIDPSSPEVSYVADQVQELERQIREEREKAVGPTGRDLNKLTSQAESLKSDVEFATTALEAARLAVDNSRRESQRQAKFIVMLSKPQLPSSEDMNWRWQFFLSSIGVVIVGWAVGGFVVAAVRKN